MTGDPRRLVTPESVELLRRSAMSAARPVQPEARDKEPSDGLDERWAVAWDDYVDDLRTRFGRRSPQWRAALEDLLAGGKGPTPVALRADPAAWRGMLRELRRDVEVQREAAKTRLLRAHHQTWWHDPVRREPYRNRVLAFNRLASIFGQALSRRSSDAGSLCRSAENEAVEIGRKNFAETGDIERALRSAVVAYSRFRIIVTEEPTP